jgi:hypothetical protein
MGSSSSGIASASASASARRSAAQLPQPCPGPGADRAAAAPADAGPASWGRQPLHQAAQDRSKRARFEHSQAIPLGPWPQPVGAPWLDRRPTEQQMDQVLCQFQSGKLLLVAKSCRRQLGMYPEFDRMVPGPNAGPNAGPSDGAAITKRLEILFDDWRTTLGPEIRSRATQTQFPSLFPQSMVRLLVHGLGASVLYKEKTLIEAQQAARKYVGLRVGHQWAEDWQPSTTEKNILHYREFAQAVRRFGTRLPEFAAIVDALEGLSLPKRLVKILGQMIDFGTGKDLDIKNEFGAAWSTFVQKFLHPDGCWDPQAAEQFTNEFVTQVLPQTNIAGEEHAPGMRGLQISQSKSVMKAVGRVVMAKAPPAAQPVLTQAQVNAAPILTTAWRELELFALCPVALVEIRAAFVQATPTAANAAILNALLMQFVENSVLVFAPGPHQTLPFQTGQQLQHFVRNLWQADGKCNAQAMLDLVAYSYIQYEEQQRIALQSENPVSLISDKEFAQNCCLVFSTCVRFLL